MSEEKNLFQFSQHSSNQLLDLATHHANTFFSKSISYFMRMIKVTLRHKKAHI